MAAGRAVGPVELDHPLAQLAHGDEQARRRSRRCSQLSRPHPQPAVPIGQLDERGVAVGVSSGGEDFLLAAGARRDNGRGVGVFVGVDPDDDIDDLCETDHAFFSLPERDVRFRSGSEIGRTVTGHASTIWRSSS